jgi:hypothetical protein
MNFYFYIRNLSRNLNNFTHSNHLGIDIKKPTITETIVGFVRTNDYYNTLSRASSSICALYFLSKASWN